MISSEVQSPLEMKTSSHLSGNKLVPQWNKRGFFKRTIP